MKQLAPICNMHVTNTRDGSCDRARLCRTHIYNDNSIICVLQFVSTVSNKCALTKDNSGKYEKILILKHISIKYISALLYNDISLSLWLIYFDMAELVWQATKRSPGSWPSARCSVTSSSSASWASWRCYTTPFSIGAANRQVVPVTGSCVTLQCLGSEL